MDVDKVEPSMNFPERFEKYGLRSKFVYNAGGSFLLVGGPFIVYLIMYYII